MINAKVAEMLNQQITEEFYAAFLYLSMSAQAEDMNLKGLANWFYVQHQEEHTHAMNIFKYLVDQGQKVTLKSIREPKNTWQSPLEMANDALTHEQLVTSMFQKMMEVAHAEKDYASIAFMNWYITEQVEEEANATDLVNSYEIAGDDKRSQMFVDRELSGRKFKSDLAVKATPVQLGDDD